MSAHPFQKFLELVTFDQQLVQYNKQIEALTKEIKALNEHINSIEKTTALAQQHWHKLRADVDAKELEMQELVTAEKKIQAKLEALERHTEYAPLKKELEATRAKQHDFEQVLIKTWQLAETAEKEYQACQAINKEKSDGYADQAAKKTQELEEIKHKIAQFRVDREQKLVDIPAEWLQKYIMMQSRVTNPVVAVVNGACGACNFQVPPQDIAILRKRGLAQCKECYRFLYIPEIMQETVRPDGA